MESQNRIVFNVEPEFTLSSLILEPDWREIVPAYFLRPLPFFLEATVAPAERYPRLRPVPLAAAKP